MSDRTYQGKHVVVTGGSSGVGAELVDQLAGSGAQVTVLDRQTPRRDDVTFLEVDLADRDSLDATAGRIDGAVDVLFNNAGVAATVPGPVVMAVNFLAPRRLTELLLPQMSDGGAVVNTASTAGGAWMEHLDPISEVLGIDDWGQVHRWVEDHPDVAGDVYAFSKECVQALTVFTAKRAMEHGVRLDAVCPGVIETPLLADFKATMSETVLDWMIAQGNGRRARAEEIASILAFVGSPDASYLHGVNIVADGGFSAAMTAGQVDFASYPT